MESLDYKQQSWFSIEFLLFIILGVTYLYPLILIRSQDDTHVHEFSSLQELKQSVIECHIQRNSSDSYDYIEYKPTQSDNENLAHLRPLCPIDEDRLMLMDKIRLDTWLNYRHIGRGGVFKPLGCRTRQKVAIVIPYRDRKEHLETFTLYIHQFLPDQLVEYTVYVIEQSDGKPFNRATLFNIGVAEIRRLKPSIGCFIFHDVDLIPLDQKNLYMCSYMPRHLSSSVDTLRYTILYPNIFGGVISMTKDQYDVIGGFSNDFYGWGGEDDDIFQRVINAGLSIERTYRENGLYMMLKHPKSKPNPRSLQLLDSMRTNTTDPNLVVGKGLNYAVKDIHHSLLYTRLLIDLI